MQLVYEEIGHIAELVNSGKIQDSVQDILGHILEAEGAAPVHSSLVLPTKNDGDSIGDDLKANSIPQHVLWDTVLGPQSVDHSTLQYLHAAGTRVGSKLNSVVL